MTGNKRDWSKQHCCHENSDVCSLLPSSMVTSHPLSVAIELTLLSQHECDLPLNTHIDVLSCICNVMSTGRLCRLYRNLGWCYIWVMEFPFIFIYTYKMGISMIITKVRYYGQSYTTTSWKTAVFNISLLQLYYITVCIGSNRMQFSFFLLCA